MRDLIFDVNYCSRTVFVRYGSHNENDVSALLASFHFNKL